MVARDKTQYLIRHAYLRQINRRRIQAAAHAEGHVLVADELLVGQNLKQPTALRLLDIDRFIELIRQEETVLDNHIVMRSPKDLLLALMEELSPRLQLVDLLQRFDEGLLAEYDVTL